MVNRPRADIKYLYYILIAIDKKFRNIKRNINPYFQKVIYLDLNKRFKGIVKL